MLSRWAFSLNLMNGEPFFQALLFGVAAVAALQAGCTRLYTEDLQDGQRIEG